MEPKMTDIAREAGVSIATVGRVIHNNGYVSEEARARVEAAVKKLGYVPNTAARTLTTKRSGIIGCLAVEHASNLHQEVSRAVMAAAEKKGYRLFTMQSRVDVRDEEEIIRQFIGLRVDGLVVISNIFLKEEHLQLLNSRHIPVVAIERPYTFESVDNVCFRDKESAYDGTVKMLEAGHKHVAFLGPKPFHVSETERLEGFQKAMEDYGVPREEQILCLTETYKILYGREGMEKLLALPERPTAVLCTGDTLAAGAMQILYEKGMRVPDDMSISGYDNTIAQELSPPINSVEPDLENVGEVAIQLLTERMEEPEGPSRTVYLDMRYIDRGTVKNK